MPCVNLRRPDREQILRKINTSIEDPATPIAHRKQFGLLRNLLKDPEKPTAQYIWHHFRFFREEEMIQRVSSASVILVCSSVLSLRSVTIFPGDSVHIQSTNPRDAPAIVHGTLLHPVDLELHARQNMWLGLQRPSGWHHCSREEESVSTPRSH